MRLVRVARHAGQAPAAAGVVNSVRAAAANVAGRSPPGAGSGAGGQRESARGHATLAAPRRPL